MFAVPGWDLARLQSQEGRDTGQTKDFSKKRKRAHEEKTEPEVTQSNVATLWGQHVERSMDRVGLWKSNDNWQQGHNNTPDNHRLDSQRAISGHGESCSRAAVGAEPPNPRRREKRTRKQKAGLVAPGLRSHDEQRHTVEALPTVTTESQVKLTPLQAAMRQKLLSARFRHLNQTLYTSPSAEARALFDSNPSFFDEYHAGFRQQVSTWPENPVDGYIKELEERGKAQISNGGKPKKLKSKGEVIPLPRSHGVCTVADMGCGDGRMANQLKEMDGSMGLRILSYDLYSSNPLVTKSDISNLPLEDGSVDVAVLCLALMGTNWVDFVEEAWRILRWKGELWVAEIKSRFGRAKRRRVDHSVGRRKKAGKQRAEEDENEQQDHLRVEVDGSESGEGQTDVSAFVQVLERRGFALQAERAVDMSNKMFVKLRFAKSRAPTKGKHLEQGAKSRQEGKQQSAAHLKQQVEDGDGEEAAVLKPCLYKTR